MTRRNVDEDGIEELEGDDLKKAMQRLGRGPMRFAFGCKDGKPVLLMHPTKSAKALSQKLRAELGATKTTHGTASADGKAVVLDVEGAPVSGMGRMVKTLLRKENVGKYTQARVRVEGEELVEDDGDGELDGDDPALAAMRELRARIQASEKGLAAVLPRLGQGSAEDRAFVLEYCRNSAELQRGTQGCSDPELAAYGKACAGRARKVAEYLKAGAAKNGASCAPAASLGGSVGKGGGNARADVALVQTLLAQQGYRVAADGLCGPATIAAIVAFQRAHVGVGDGLVEPGRNTWRALTGQALAKPGYGAMGNGCQKPGPGYGTKPAPGYGTREKRPRVEEELGSQRYGEDFPHYGYTEQGSAQKLAGSAYSKKTADGEIDVLSGQLEVDGDNVAASGTLARYKHGGTTDTLGQFEYKSGVFTEGDAWWAGKKVSEVDAKREIDFTEEYGLDDRIVLKGDAAVGTASAEASISDQGAVLGAQANAAEASFTLGTTGTGDQDQTVRMGASAGVGMAGRVHWGDADKDGNPEYGAGFDYGPVSFDIKTEDPLKTAFQNSGGPLTQGASELYDGNMTNDAMAAAEEAGREIGGMAEAASQWLSGDEG